MFGNLPEIALQKRRWEIFLRGLQMLQYFWNDTGHSFLCVCHQIWGYRWSFYFCVYFRFRLYFSLLPLLDKIKKKFNVRKSTIDSYTNIDNSHSTIYLISSKQFLKVIVFTYLLCRYRPISGRIKSSSWLFTFSLTGSLP